MWGKYKIAKSEKIGARNEGGSGKEPLF